MKPVIAIHGGAGVLRADRPGERHRGALKRALEAGYEVLHRKIAVDAVAAAVVVLEDSPLFNAGRGSSFNTDAEIEMDASIMDGATLRAGAVAAVRRIRNPVLAARAVMERSRHVLLAGSGAERFARKQGLKFEPPEYFHTGRRMAALRKNLSNYHGTVGAVALDADGNLAAATSTGGYTGKMPGRVGDSPLVGAGTYADNRACAVSGTGLGEALPLPTTCAPGCAMAVPRSRRRRPRRSRPSPRWVPTVASSRSTAAAISRCRSTAKACSAPASTAAAGARSRSFESRAPLRAASLDWRACLALLVRRPRRYRPAPLGSLDRKSVV